SHLGVRHAGGSVHTEPQHRQFPQLTRCQVCSATMRFWIPWRFWHDSDAALGQFLYPDPARWPDEEVGVLPGDED
uniref:NADH dehydrogenase [ubiquinone] 1 beta subcomplex subunit 2, mitochondrial n=1 Tax=Oryctolagus cuniculus TaxID=9986 RepID=G1TID7_RABIT